MSMSPAQVAKHLGISRATVSRMLLAGEIKGQRNNRGHWKINEEDLPEPVKITDEQSADSEHEQIIIARLEERLAAAERRAQELEKDRDAWRQQADKLTAQRGWKWPWKG